MKGGALTQLGDAEAAADPLRAARDLFLSFGALPLLAQADEWLALAGPRQAGRRPA